MTSSTQVAAPPTPIFSARYRSVVLSLLVTAYAFNFIDRTIINTIGQAIKVDLKITDSQLGLLNGPAFALLYSILGVPIARVAERVNRVSIIAGAIVLWSGFTAACGFTANFAQLLAMRVGVGIGEAGCSPPSHSLISDYFEPRRRASALAMYAAGIPVGGMIGAVAGGWLAQHFGWRVAFMAVGAPGLLLALVMKLVVREPPRGLSDPAGGQTGQRPLTGGLGAVLASEVAEMWAIAKILFGSWPVANIILGITIVSFSGYGAGAFSSPYFIRAFGLDYAKVGLIFGLIAGVSGLLGTLAGGLITDWAGRWDKRWYALTPAIGLTLAIPMYFFAYTRPDWKVAAATLLIPGIFAYTYLGPSFGVVQNVVDPRRRATAAAVMLLFVNIIALGAGPPFTGALIDAFAQFHFNHPGAGGLFASLSGLFGGHGPLNFAHACPGGKAAEGAGAALAMSCKAALVVSTRQGMLVTIAISFWGAIHYFLGSIGLRAAMAGPKSATIT